MKVFFVRFILIAILFLGGAFLSSISEKSYLALPLWYSAVAIWTLILGYRKSLLIVIPFLLLADVLWDGKVGAVFLVGFLLGTATTYLTVRIETRSRTLQMLIYSLLIGLASSLAIGASLGITSATEMLSTLGFLPKVSVIQFLAAAIFFPIVSWIIQGAEKWLDTSYREQMKKIR
jgi:hypothetical protein